MVVFVTSYAELIPNGGFPLLRQDGSNSLFDRGSTSSCALKFLGDENTGIISPAADEIALVTGGVSRLTIDSNGAATFTGNVQVNGALTVTGNAYFNGNVDIGGDITFDEVNARNLNISGISTLGFATAANAYVAGMTTTHLLNVGFGATMVKVQGTPATRVGINSIGPAFTLDVDGDSNVTGTARQGGTSIVTLASAAAVGDATALAIALG